MGRRNLTDELKTYCIGKIYEARKNSHGGDRKSSDHSDPLKQGRISEQLGEELGVGDATVKMSYEFSQGAEALKEHSEDAFDKVMNGTARVSKKVIRELRNAEKIRT